MFLKKEGIRSRIAVGIDHIDDGAMILADGEQLPFAFAMVVPPFLGQDFLRDTPGPFSATRSARSNVCP